MCLNPSIGCFPLLLPSRWEIVTFEFITIINQRAVGMNEKGVHFLRPAAKDDPPGHPDYGRDDTSASR
jgi:hypothetical protein